MSQKTGEECKEGILGFGFTPHVIEVHGNVKYMHCSNEEKECSKNFYLSPSLACVKDFADHVPLCHECGAWMKPHCMFFDESYSEHFYRVETINAFLEEGIDCLIVVGTALATG